jgi:hypothetical protein
LKRALRQQQVLGRERVVRAPPDDHFRRAEGGVAHHHAGFLPDETVCKRPD